MNRQRGVRLVRDGTSKEFSKGPLQDNANDLYKPECDSRAKMTRLTFKIVTEFSKPETKDNKVSFVFFSFK